MASVGTMTSRPPTPACHGARGAGDQGWGPPRSPARTLLLPGASYSLVNLNKSYWHSWHGPCRQNWGEAPSCSQAGLLGGSRDPSLTPARPQFPHTGSALRSPKSHGELAAPLPWEGGTGHCHRLLSLCHAGTVLPAALTAPSPPPPVAIFIPPPQRCFSLFYFKRCSWRTGNPVPSSWGPRTASLPAHAARVQGAMPREAAEGRQGSGLGVGGGPGTLGGTGWHRAMGLGRKQRPNAALRCRGCGQRCPPMGKKGVVEGCGRREQGWGRGQAAGWQSPSHQTYMPGCAPPTVGEQLPG